MVAGIITGNGYNDKGSAGVCWSGNVKSLKADYLDPVTETYRFETSAVIAAIEYADTIGIKILNISLGGFPDDDKLHLQEAIENFDGLVICSAGNDCINSDMYPLYPAAFDCDNIISVGALNETNDGMWIGADQEQQGSNFGATSVDVFAPGCNVYTTDNTGGYTSATGTSFAAPYVTGLAALIWQAKPDLTAAEVKAAILDNVDELDSLDGFCVTGGRINAYKALRSVLTKKKAKVFTGYINNDDIEDHVVIGKLNGYYRFSTFLGNSDGSFDQAIHTFSNKEYTHSNPWFIGDVNGDGCDDLVLHWVTNEKRQLMTFLSKKDGTFKLTSSYIGYNSAINLKYTTDTNPSVSFLRDVTGDGCADFVCHMKTDDGYRGFWVYKGISGGTGFNTTAVTSTSTRAFIESDPVYMDDVNGDGYDDLVVHWVSDGKRQLLTYTATGTGSFNTPVNLATSNTHDQTVYPSALMLGDTTGDGKADFIVMWKNSAGYRCILSYTGTTNSSGKATFNAGQHVLTSTCRYVEDDPVYLADVSGDGRQDVVVYWVSDIYRQILVYKATSSSFNEGVNYSSTNKDTSSYPNDRRFVDVSTAEAGKEFVFRWCQKTKQVMNFQTFTCATSGLFYGSPVKTELMFFPHYNY